MTLIHKHYQMGKAPYKYVGLWSSPSKALLESNPNAYNNSVAARPKCCHYTCDHCGMPIEHHYMVQDAEGKRFSVGCECIRKMNDVQKMTKAEADKKAHDRKLRKARADKKREEKRIAQEAELQSQRDANGGLTDWELKEKIRQDAIEAERNANFKDAEYFITALKASGSFARDLAESFYRRSLPKGRGVNITLDMVAKYYSGAKQARGAKYDAAYIEADEKFELLNKQWGK